MIKFTFNAAYARRIRDALTTNQLLPNPRNSDELLMMSAACQLVAYYSGEGESDPARVLVVNDEQVEAILTSRVKCIRGIVNYEFLLMGPACGGVGDPLPPDVPITGHADPESESSLPAATVTAYPPAYQG